MRNTKIISVLCDCTSKIALLFKKRNNYKFKYSTSVQISSNVGNVLAASKKTAKGFIGSKKIKKLINSVQEQRTLR